MAQRSHNGGIDARCTTDSFCRSIQDSDRLSVSLPVRWSPNKEMLDLFVATLLEQDLRGIDLSLGEAIDLVCAKLGVPRQVALRAYFLAKAGGLCRIWAVPDATSPKVIIALSNRGLQSLAEREAKVTQRGSK